MNDAIAKVTGSLEAYKFNEAAKELYDFVWGDFCDWYIEASKVAPNIPVLEEVFNTILRLLHPFAPFITEELWTGMGFCGSGLHPRSAFAELRQDTPVGVTNPSHDTIQFASWPVAREFPGATVAHAAKMDALYAVIGAGRQLRNDYGIEPKRQVKFVIKTADNFFANEVPSLKMFLNAEDVAIDQNYAPTGVTPSIVTSAATVFMVGAVDIEAERQRLTKQLAEIEKNLASTEAKLANENFVSRAAPVAVQRERDRQQQLREQREKVKVLLQSL
jgi:valyl-tRNA synthetase